MAPFQTATPIVKRSYPYIYLGSLLYLCTAYKPYLIVILNLGVAPTIRCKGQLPGVLYDSCASDMEMELRREGTMNTKLLTSQHKHTVSAVLQEDGA